MGGRGAEGVSVFWVGGKPGLETVQSGNLLAVFLACSLNCSQNIVSELFDIHKLLVSIQLHRSYREIHQIPSS